MRPNPAVYFPFGLNMHALLAGLDCLSVHLGWCPVLAAAAVLCVEFELQFGVQGCTNVGVNHTHRLLRCSVVRLMLIKFFV